MLGIVAECSWNAHAWILFHFASETLLVAQVSETISLDASCVACAITRSCWNCNRTMKNSG